MIVKYKKPKYWCIVLIPFGLLLTFGLFSLLACHGECGASNHGGVLDYIHSKLYISWEVTIPSIVFGAIGSIIGLMLLLYYLVIIYEAEFEKDVITLHKKTENLAIGIKNIESIEYVRPTLLNYILSGIAPGSSTYPGRLQIRTKIKIGKSKLHVVKIKYKEVLMLPSSYLEIIDPANILKWK